MATTSLEAIRAANAAEEIALSGWTPGTEFVCRVRRPRLYELAAAGEIPNPLLPIVEELFMRNTAALQKRDISDQSKALLALAGLALVEPTAAEIHDVGAVLTDDQLLEIYTYVLGGAAALAGFRAQQGSNAGGNVAAAGGKGKRAAAS